MLTMRSLLSLALLLTSLTLATSNQRKFNVKRFKAPSHNRPEVDHGKPLEDVMMYEPEVDRLDAETKKSLLRNRPETDVVEVLKLLKPETELRLEPSREAIMYEPEVDRWDEWNAEAKKSFLRSKQEVDEAEDLTPMNPEVIISEDRRQKVAHAPDDFLSAPEVHSPERENEVARMEPEVGRLLSIVNAIMNVLKEPEADGRDEWNAETKRSLLRIKQEVDRLEREKEVAHVNPEVDRFLSSLMSATEDVASDAKGLLSRLVDKVSNLNQVGPLKGLKEMMKDLLGQVDQVGQSLPFIGQLMGKGRGHQEGGHRKSPSDDFRQVLTEYVNRIKNKDDAQTGSGGDRKLVRQLIEALSEKRKGASGRGTSGVAKGVLQWLVGLLRPLIASLKM